MIWHLALKTLKKKIISSSLSSQCVDNFCQDYTTAADYTTGWYHSTRRYVSKEEFNENQEEQEKREDHDEDWYEINHKKAKKNWIQKADALQPHHGELGRWVVAIRRVEMGKWVIIASDYFNSFQTISWIIRRAYVTKPSANYKNKNLQFCLFTYLKTVSA